MNKIYKFSAWWMACLVLLSSLTFTACDTNDVDTNQYKGGISLNVFGPSPVLRGGELRFLGCGMDQVASVLIPGCDAITDIQLISAEEIRVIVPQTALPGYVTLMLRNGESIITKTQLTYSEPVSIESFSPESVRPGDVLTIKGEYLNLIHQVIFADNVVVSDEIAVEEEEKGRTTENAGFLKHTRNEIQVLVPYEARSGKICLSDGAELPNLLYAEVELQVTTPSVAQVEERIDVKPGEEMSVIGEDLDLVEEIQLSNGEPVEFTYSAENNTLTFKLPDNAVDGPVYAVPASGVKVQVAEIKLATPEDVKAQEAEIATGKELTLTGKNMDMIAAVLFPGVEKAVVPSSLSETEVKVVVPGEAQTGMIQLVLTSGETISGPELTITAPKYCQIADESVLENDFFIGENGEDMVITVVNGDELAEVQIGDEQVRYSVSGDQLTIQHGNVPQATGEYTLKLISEDGTAKEYTVSFAKVIWTGTHDFTTDWKGFESLKDLAIWQDVQSGTEITIYYKLNESTSNYQIKLCDGNWTDLTDQYHGSDLLKDATDTSFILSADDLSKLKSTGLVVNGCGITMTKVTLK